MGTLASAYQGPADSEGCGRQEGPDATHGGHLRHRAERAGICHCCYAHMERCCIVVIVVVAVVVVVVVVVAVVGTDVDETSTTIFLSALRSNIDSAIQLPQHQTATKHEHRYQREVGSERGLRHVLTFNVRGRAGEDVVIEYFTYNINRQGEGLARL